MVDCTWPIAKVDGPSEGTLHCEQFNPNPQTGNDRSPFGEARSTKMTETGRQCWSFVAISILLQDTAPLFPDRNFHVAIVVQLHHQRRFRISDRFVVSQISVKPDALIKVIESIKTRRE